MQSLTQFPQKVNEIQIIVKSGPLDLYYMDEHSYFHGIIMMVYKHEISKTDFLWNMGNLGHLPFLTVSSSASPIIGPGIPG